MYIMRTKSIMQGFTCKKWIAIAEGPRTAAGARTLLCKCMACGATKTIRAKDLGSGTAADCRCDKTAPAILPKNKGVSCKSRLKHCRKSASGFCCIYCEQKNECEDACLNRPDKCGSYFDDKKVKP